MKIRPRSYLVIIYLTIALLSVLVMLNAISWFRSKDTTPSYSPIILFKDDFSSHRQGDQIDKNSTWQYFSPDDENTKRPRWFYSLGHFYHEPNTPADYTSDPNSFLESIVIAGDQNWDNYMYRLRLEPVDDEGLGIVFRYKDSSNFYRLVMSKDSKAGGPYLKFEKRVEGKISTIATQTDPKLFHGDYQNGTWYTPKVVANGSDFQFFINGVQVLQAHDSSFSKGKIGLMTWKHSAGFFDDVVITKID